MQEAITFDDVLLIPSFNEYESRRQVTTSSTDKTRKLTLELPIITSNMDTVTGSAMANFISERGGIGALHRFMSIDSNVREFKQCQRRVFVSVGVTESELARAEALRDAGADYFCVDVAHAHAAYVGRTLKALRQMMPNACIMAGNVATREGAQYLADHGADLIKVGIGGGSVCSTRIKTGFGVPTLSSIELCSQIDRSIVADGGIRTAGDVVKALAFGADFVMIGGMLAGTKPTPGSVIERDGVLYKEYRGMASKEAQEDFMGAMSSWKTAEGVSTLVKFSEAHNDIIDDIAGGLRSGLTYAGAGSIRELQEKVQYVVVTQSGKIESMPHKTLKI